MQLVYRLYLVQIILLLLSVMLPGILKVLAIVPLVLLMTFLWFVLWGAAHLERKQAEIQEMLEEMRPKH